MTPGGRASEVVFTQRLEENPFVSDGDRTHVYFGLVINDFSATNAVLSRQTAVSEASLLSGIRTHGLYRAENASSLSFDCMD
jgi:hypothetical protein